jgi:hypothetical protein
MDRRNFLIGLSAAGAASAATLTPAFATVGKCLTFRQMAGMEVEYYGPRQIVIRQGSLSIGNQCNQYSLMEDAIVDVPGDIARGWNWVWAIGNPKTGRLQFSIQPVFATSTFANHFGADFRSDGWSDFRMLPIAVFWDGLKLRPWFLDGGYPQPSIWWTETQETAQSAITLVGSGKLYLRDWVPETGRAFFASVEATTKSGRPVGKIGTPRHGWYGLKPTPGDREIRDVRLLPNSGEEIRYDLPPGMTVRMWPRGWTVEQPV